MELIKAIGLRLGQGEPLAKICREIDICDDSVRNWMRDDKEVFLVIARGRAEGCHFHRWIRHRGAIAVADVEPA